MMSSLDANEEQTIANLRCSRLVGLVQALDIGVSCGTFFRAEIAVELAQQGITILLRPIGQVRDEVFDLLASGFTKSFDPTEVGRIRLDQGGVELMLANELAEMVTDCPSAVVSIGRLRRKFFGLGRGCRRLREGANLFDGADADSVGFPQSSVDSASFGNAHFGAVDKEGNIGRIGVAISNKASTGFDL